MKVLLIGSNFHNYINSLATAFEENGCEVKVYMPQVYWELSLLGRIHFRLTTSIRKLYNHKQFVYVKPKQVRRKESMLALQAYSEFQPDIVVDFSSYYLENEVLEKMKNCKKIIWIYDAIERLPHLYDKLPYYDQVYFFEGTDKSFFEEHNIKASFLPLCADDKVYHPVERRKDVDISFVGNLSNERIQFLLDLKHRFPECNIKVYGRVPMFYSIFNSNKKYIKKYSDMFLNCYISPKDANELYAKSKICINVHNGQTVYGANIRFFEIMAAGGFQIVDDNEYIRTNFDGCVATYKNQEDLLDKVEYYLSHPLERNRIAQNGYKAVFGSELFYHRAKLILSNAKEAEGEKK